MKHKHAELMMEYAQDAMETDRPWERWEFRFEDDDDWKDLIDHAIWRKDCEYRRKPRTVNINGFEVPEPVRQSLNINDKYYVVRPDRECHFHRGSWDNSQAEHIWLKLGLIHRTAEAAAKHAEALLSFTRIEK